MLYPVTITEELKRTVWVEAESPVKAEEQTEQLYNSGKIELGMEDICDDREIEFDPEITDWADPWDDHYCYINGKLSRVMLDTDGKPVYENDKLVLENPTDKKAVAVEVFRNS